MPVSCKIFPPTVSYNTHDNMSCMARPGRRKEWRLRWLSILKTCDEYQSCKADVAMYQRGNVHDQYCIHEQRNTHPHHTQQTHSQRILLVQQTINIANSSIMSRNISMPWGIAGRVYQAVVRIRFPNPLPPRTRMVGHDIRGPAVNELLVESGVGKVA